MKHNKHRQTLEICSDILEVASRPVRKTRIVYGANLNFVMVSDYLETLQEHGLLMKIGDHYQATEAGNEFRRRLALAREPFC